MKDTVKDDNQLEYLKYRKEREIISGALLGFINEARKVTSTGMQGVMVALAISYVGNSHGVNVSQLSDITRINRRTVRRILETLLDEGHLRKDSSGEWPVYYGYVPEDRLDDVDKHDSRLLDAMCDMCRKLKDIGHT